MICAVQSKKARAEGRCVSGTRIASYACTSVAVGNRKQLTSTVAAIPATGLLNYDANDRLSTQLYDNNGNTVNNGTLNVYDFENRLVQRGNVHIVYDGDGNRVSETVGGATVSYLVADVNPTGYPQVVQERQDQFGSILKNYEWGLQLIAEGDLSQSPLHYYGMGGHGSVRYQPIELIRVVEYGSVDVRCGQEHSDAWAISAKVAFSTADKSSLPLIWPLRILFSAARYSFLSSSSWSTSSSS